jgi:hypothetical protein
MRSPEGPEETSAKLLLLSGHKIRNIIPRSIILGLGFPHRAVFLLLSAKGANYKMSSA